DATCRDERRAFRIFGRQLRTRTGLQLPMDVEHRRMDLDVCMRAKRAADDQPRPQPVAGEGRQIGFRMMRERRGGLLVLAWQRYPRLDTVQRAACSTCALEPLRVRDATTGRHPVELARPDPLFRA